jgi:hypothetical protein
MIELPNKRIYGIIQKIFVADINTYFEVIFSF